MSNSNVLAAIAIEHDVKFALLIISTLNLIPH